MNSALATYDSRHFYADLYLPARSLNSRSSSERVPTDAPGWIPTMSTPSPRSPRRGPNVYSISTLIRCDVETVGAFHPLPFGGSVLTAEAPSIRRFTRARTRKFR